jgi:hypothetical protein
MSTYDRIGHLVTRLTAMLALIVAIGLPGFYAAAAYLEATRSLDSGLQTQAAVLEQYIQLQPDFWELNADRMQAVFEPYVAPQTYYRVSDKTGQTVFAGGPSPDWLTLVRSRPLYAFGHRVGHVEAGNSMFKLLLGGMLLGFVGLAIAWTIWGPLRRVPLQALRDAETALMERARYQRALLDNSPFMAWLTDREGRILAANTVLAEMLGSEAGSLEGRKLVEIMPQNHLGLYVENEKRVQETGRPIQFETRLEDDGQERWFDVGLSSVGLADGEALGTVGYAREITEAKAAGAVLARYRQHLEEMVRVRTDELSAALASAEAASRAKTEFLASMSHELRTPLNAILGFSQLLAMDPQLHDDSRDMAGEIDRAGQHLLALVNDLIDIARIESGNLALSIEAVLVRTVADDSLRLVAPLASEYGIAVAELDCQCNIDRITVQADYQRLRQVLLNLLSNGIKYNRPGGTVRLCCLRHEEKVRIQVEDSGPGIPPEKLSRLFSAFDRLGAECGTVQGTGIGLLISKRIVESMGGTIGVASVEGSGSTFWVEFPMGEISESAVAAPAGAATSTGGFDVAPLPAACRPARRVVLYVEDNPTNQELIQRFIARKRQDLELRGAESAEDGIALARAAPPALILMDINLPGMNGYAALAELKADARTAHVPVVAMSAHSMKEDVERGRQAGFAAYVTKPIDLGKLLAVLDRQLPVGSPADA